MNRDLQTLTVIIPVFNQAAEIGSTLTALEQAASATSFVTNIVVVDDGSTDGTAAAARATKLSIPLEVLEQENHGRFEARLSGLARANGRYCLLLDSRVRIDQGALRFVEDQLRADPEKEIWNSHVRIDLQGGPYAVFWDVITCRAWWHYFGNPRTTSFGLDDFDRFPKGTTCLFAPRASLTTAFSAFRSAYADLRYANDDAPLLRTLAAEQRINLSPFFGCRYASRTQLKPFLRHAFHRGTVFVDGHGRPDAGWFPIVVGLFAGSAACVALSRRHPVILPVSLAAASAAGAAVALSEQRPAAAPTMAWVTPLYTVAHIAGMWRGLWMALRDRLRAQA